MKTKTENLFLLPALIAVLLFQQTTMATTLTVTSTADSGAGTLRAALASAANGDTIDASGVTGAMLLTSGELLVTNSVTILGPGPSSLAVNGNAASRVFHIVSNNVVTIAGLTITNGKVSGGYPANSGGGIYASHGTLTVSNCTLSGNSAGYGGAIYNDGYKGTATLVVSTSTLNNNSVTGSGGGIYNDGDSGSVTLQVVTSTLSSNSASFGGSVYNGGYKGSATLQVVTSTISSNSVSGSGGGIYNNGESSGNGIVTVSNCTLSGNSATGNSGGGIFNDGTSSGHVMLTFSASTVSNNSASYGGGIENSGYGGSATLLALTSTLSGNSASVSGGGIYNNGQSSGTGTVQIIASTLSANRAAHSYGGGIYNDGTSSGKVILLVRASTFSGNSASGGTGGAIRNDGGGGSANVEIGSTILKAGDAGANIVNLSGTVTSDGYNLTSDSGGGFLTGTADQINTDPMLGPLQDNGGPTFTHALLPGSPAIDKGKNFNGSATDQREFPRILDRPCIANSSGGDGTDIGAFEVQQPCPVVLPLVNVGVVSGHFGFDVAGSSNQVVVVEVSTDLVSWTALVTNTLGASPLHFSDPDSTNFQQRFYRAKLVP